MNLYQALRNARTEEDVKDAYIKALGLKRLTKGLIDIQTDEIWFEAKDTGRHSCYAMFTQLLHYVQQALNKGENVAPFLAVIDTEKAAIMRSADVLPFLRKKTVKWGKSASQYPQEAFDAVSAYIGTHFVQFRIETDAGEFIQTVKSAIETGEIIRTAITPANLKQVFDKWVVMIGREIEGVNEEDYALLFFADIMHDGTMATHQDLPAELLHKNGKPAFQLGRQVYELHSNAGYQKFWAIYHRPPEQEYRNYLLERRDSLIPLDERGFKGAFYTPLHVVEKAYDLLLQTLGKKWQQDYLIWDMCCGVGNLEVKHSNHRNLFMSTLDAADVNVMKATKTCAASQRFQYDYLNDDIANDGSIDYGLTNKIPQALRDYIAAGRKILVLINPPYAEAMKADNIAEIEDKSESKKGVAATRVASHMDAAGYASRELFTQFLTRIKHELPTATVAMFSTLKYVNAPNFEKFREHWNAKYLDGFVVHSKAFDGLNGNFPIGFLIWQTENRPSARRTPITRISAEVLDKDAQPIGEKKFHNISASNLMGEWIIRPKPNSIDALPLKSALSPTTSTKDVRGDKWAAGAIGGMICKGSDFQNTATGTALLSSGYCSAGGFLVTDTNLWQAAVAFAARLVFKKTWLNDRDQFLAPAKVLPAIFESDCLIWMLFHNQNLSAGADNLNWNGRTWSLVNNFIPYSEDEVGSPEAFESNFMRRVLAQRELSPEAQAVLDAGCVVWASYFKDRDARSVREQFRLNRPDVGWYQIRNALKARGTLDTSGMPALKSAHDTLAEKLKPLVFEYGMLLS
jgi:hypothetical protein